MAKPKYKYELSVNKPFVNPYNFVQTNVSRIARNKLETTKEGTLHTGVLNCKLITRTPLAVPDTDFVTDSKKHKTFDFFNYGDGMPVIPGSTLRGVIRNVYEAASDSCFSTAREGAIITTRSSKEFKPGVLKWNKETKKWDLYTATRYIFVVKDNNPDENRKEYATFTQDADQYKIVSTDELKKYNYGDIVRFKASGGEYRKRGHLVGKYALDFSTDLNDRKLPLVGYLYIGEKFHGKHFESIFYTGQKAEVVASFSSKDKSMLGLEETRQIYNDEKINRMLTDEHKFYSGFMKARRKGIIPLWYREEDNGVYLSLACLGRIAYQNTMGDVLKEKKPCVKREAVCKACALFGMASNEESIGSRVRFTDATVTTASKDECYMKKSQTLKELAGPKISYLPFYVNGRGDKWSYDEASSSIRGRKFYWHTTNSNAYTTDEKTERNLTMQLVKPEVEFKFQVYFNNITDTQLAELEWALTFGENKADGSLCHKVGHGKPIGLGSAKIVIESCVERNVGEGYKLNESKPAEVIPADAFSGKAVEELLIIADMKTTEKKDVRYPYIDNPDHLPFKPNSNNTASHKWFSKNYSLGADSAEQKWQTIKEVSGKGNLYAYDIRKE